MKKYSYIPTGVCSSKMDFEINDDNTINKIIVKNGCPGNLIGISRLCEGKKIEEVIELLDGIKCGYKMTSCPDQIAKALKQISGVEKNKGSNASFIFFFLVYLFQLYFQ